jgi:hypothetical protein
MGHELSHLDLGPVSTAADDEVDSSENRIGGPPA